MKKDISGNKSNDYVLYDKDVLSMNSVLSFDNEYQSLLNKKIKSIQILTFNNLNSKQQGLPSETGVVLVLEDETKLILSHNLTENNSAFAILTDQDYISNNAIVKFKVRSNS